MPALALDLELQRLDAGVQRSFSNFLRARFTRIVCMVACSYIGLAAMLPAGWLAEVMRCCQVTLSAVVIVGYWRPATSCFYVTGRWPATTSVIALGIMLSWMSIFANSGWALLWRLSGQPAWMINNDFYTAWTAASSFAASLHIFAPNMIAQDIPRKDRRLYALAGVIGVSLAVVVGVWRPDLSFAAEWLHGYLAEPEWARRGLIQLLRAPAAYLPHWPLL